MALDFPASPSNGQKYPASPIVGVPTYTWDGEKWTAVGGLGLTAATAAEYMANSAPGKMLTSGATWGAAPPLNLGFGTTFTFDFSAAGDFIIVMNGATSLPNPTARKLGQKGLIYVCQDTSGGRLITSWGSVWKFPGSTKPVLSTAASSVDVISYAVADANQVFCTFAKAFG